jgi:CHAD domain-containing protein
VLANATYRPSPETAGRTEEIVGQWLGKKRNQFVLATKCFAPTGPSPWDAGNSRQNIMRAIDGSSVDVPDFGSIYHHRVRILGKRLRYAMEIFADCFPPEFNEQYYPTVEEMQEILGRANDSHVACERDGRVLLKPADLFLVLGRIGILPMGLSTEIIHDSFHSV